MPEWSIDSNALLPFIVILFIFRVLPASETPKGPSCSRHIPHPPGPSSPQTHVHIKTSPGRRLHSYHIDESPKTLKRKLAKADDTISAMKKRLKFSQQKTRRLSKKVASLHAIVKSLRNKRLVTPDGAEMLERTFSGGPLVVMKTLVNQKGGRTTRQRYHAVLRSFALTLQFYSAKAYNYVRQTFNLALSHSSVIRGWHKSIDGAPGFTEEAFTALKSKVEEAKTQDQVVLCSLMIDEMAIKKHIEWDGKRFLGYVDIGANIDDDSTPVASEALVFMVVALNGSWKVPCAYFLLKGMSGVERANLIRQCLMKTHDVGVKVVSLTCDGPSCHFSMMADLGASLAPPNITPHFPHPADHSIKVYVLLDVCHMLKLVRNTLAQGGILKDDKKDTIRWSFFKELHDLQENEDLHLGNKLKTAQVNLAAQTLSSSVADALEFCANDLKLTQFQGCDATVRFIRIFDHLFDVLNSRNPIAKGYKAPL